MAVAAPNLATIQLILDRLPRLVGDTGLIQPQRSAKRRQFNWKFHPSLYTIANRPRTFTTIGMLNNNVDRYLRLHLQ
jgi:DNA-binding GntR family transcriptional regulator